MAATGTPTPNIGLRIPLGTDPASVDDINFNSNLIDTKLGAVGNDSVQDQIDDLNSNIITVSNRVGWLINSGTDVVAADGVALIALYPNQKAIINIEARINTKGTGSTYSYGVNADAIKATCGKNITPVSGGTAQFFNADGTLDVNSYGEGGTWTKNGQFWTPARNYSGTSVGGWDSTHFDVGQRISGVLYGTWS